MCLFYKMAAKINWKSPTFQLRIFINKAAIIFPSKYLQSIKCFPTKMATVLSQIKLMCIKLTRVKIWKHCMLAKGKKQEKMLNIHVSKANFLCMIDVSRIVEIQELWCNFKYLSIWCDNQQNSKRQKNSWLSTLCVSFLRSKMTGFFIFFFFAEFKILL